MSDAQTEAEAPSVWQRFAVRTVLAVGLIGFGSQYLPFMHIAPDFFAFCVCMGISFFLIVRVPATCLWLATIIGAGSARHVILNHPSTYGLVNMSIALAVLMFLVGTQYHRRLSS